MARLQSLWRYLPIICSVAAMAVAVNHIFALGLFGRPLFENSFLFLLITLFLPLSFIFFPASKKGTRPGVPWYDQLLFWITLTVSIYFLINSYEMVYGAWDFNAPVVAQIMGSILWLLTLECVRRSSDLVLALLAGLISLYPLVAEYMPHFLKGHSFNFPELMQYLIMSSEGLLGIPMRAFGSLIIGYILFGVALETFGGADFFMNLSKGWMGGARGGPAKVAVLSSALFGSLSGSVISNVLTTGTITIPMMKRAGFPAKTAAAFEACASTGGSLMPPIMGTTAFIMATLLEVPYANVLLAALVPSLWYYFALLIQADLYSAKHRIGGLASEERPSLLSVLKGGWYFLAVFAVLITLIMAGGRETEAPYVATGLLFMGPLVMRSGKLTMERLLYFITRATKALVTIIAILAAVGYFIGALSVTGLALSLSSELVHIADGNVPFLLLMGALTSFILGTGLDMVASYIFLAVTLTPALGQLGIVPIVGHLFVLYWAMISYISPPVSLASTTAAVLAGSGTLETDLEAIRIGAPIYLIPFIFALNGAALIQPGSGINLMETAVIFVTALAGILFICMASQGYLYGVGEIRGTRPVRITLRTLFVLAGILLAIPVGSSGLFRIPFENGLTYFGIAMAVVLYVMAWRMHRVPAVRASS